MMAAASIGAAAMAALAVGRAVTRRSGIGVLLAALVAYGIFRWWRRGHPRKQPPAPLSYSAELSQRLQKNMNKGTKRKRRGKTARKKPPRRP